METENQDLRVKRDQTMKDFASHSEETGLPLDGDECSYGMLSRAS